MADYHNPERYPVIVRWRHDARHGGHTITRGYVNAAAARKLFNQNKLRPSVEYVAILFKGEHDREHQLCDSWSRPCAA